MAKTTEQKEEATIVRPSDLAEELEVDAKRIRAFLRTEFTRPLEAKNSSWVLTEDQANAVREHFSADDSDEEDEDE
jgi:hypothetical protein